MRYMFTVPLKSGRSADNHKTLLMYEDGANKNIIIQASQPKTAIKRIRKTEPVWWFRGVVVLNDDGQEILIRQHLDDVLKEEANEKVANVYHAHHSGTGT